MYTRCRGSRDKKVMNSALEEDLTGFLGTGAKFDLMRKREDTSRTLSIPTLPEHKVGNGGYQEKKLKREPRRQVMDTHPCHSKELGLEFWLMGGL